MSHVRSRGWRELMAEIAAFNPRWDQIVAASELGAMFDDPTGDSPLDSETDDCLLFACTQPDDGPLTLETALVHLTALAMMWAACVSRSNWVYLENNSETEQLVLMTRCARLLGPGASSGALEVICHVYQHSPSYWSRTPLALAIEALLLSAQPELRDASSESQLLRLAQNEIDATHDLEYHSEPISVDELWSSWGRESTVSLLVDEMAAIPELAGLISRLRALRSHPPQR
ncbi:MAG: hypothetical protein ACREJO_02835 [Phycisphaerales bacterium]